jgi:hypothetical protein
MIDLAAIQDDTERAKALLSLIVKPALSKLHQDGFPGNPNDLTVQTLILAISGQEADFQHRDQIESNRGDLVLGPALGLWQFERGTRVSRGGVSGVMYHSASAPYAQKMCTDLSIPFEPDTFWRKQKFDDEFACKTARLLIWTDPYKLPTNLAAAWDLYANRCWRPGKPHPAKWPTYWAIASNVVLTA